MFLSLAGWRDEPHVSTESVGNCFDLCFAVAEEDLDFVQLAGAELCLYVILKLLRSSHDAIHSDGVCRLSLPAGRLHAHVGSVHLFQRSEDQIPADPHLAHALAG